MKKFLCMLCVLMIALAMLTACGKTSGGEAGNTDNTASGSEGTSETEGAFDPAQLKTLADVFAVVPIDDYNTQMAYSEIDYCHVFSVDGVYYRVHAKMTKEVYDALDALDYMDDDLDAKQRELLGPLEITSVENLNELMPTQEEMDQWVGKTLSEVFGEDWDYWFYNLEDMTAAVNYKEFSYDLAFEYDGEPMQNTDDFDFYEAFKDLKIKSVTLSGLGDAAFVDYE